MLLYPPFSELQFIKKNFLVSLFRPYLCTYRRCYCYHFLHLLYGTGTTLPRAIPAYSCNCRIWENAVPALTARCGSLYLTESKIKAKAKSVPSDQQASQPASARRHPLSSSSSSLTTYLLILTEWVSAKWMPLVPSHDEYFNWFSYTYIPTCCHTQRWWNFLNSKSDVRANVACSFCWLRRLTKLEETFHDAAYVSRIVAPPKYPHSSICVEAFIQSEYTGEC